MSDIPVLFSGPMIRAILDDRKSQTRRILKPQPQHLWQTPPIDILPPSQGDDGLWGQVETIWSGREPSHEVWHPLNVRWNVGDRLWVQETWAMASRATDVGTIYYRASENRSYTEFCEQIPIKSCGLIQPSWPKWKPAIHMPRTFSRITLEVTEVRVERLQDISEEDAIAEGAEPILVPPDGGSAPHIEGFRAIWNRINGDGSWAANPFVTATTFRRAGER